MKKILFLLGFMCLSLVSFASQHKNEHVITPMSHYTPLGELNDDAYVSDDPDYKIIVLIDFRTYETWGIQQKFVNDGKPCITIEVWLNGSLFGTLDDCN